MTDSVLNNSEWAWSLQAAQTAPKASAVSSADAVDTAAAAAETAGTPRYDTVKISEAGEAYIDAKSAGTAAATGDNAALLKELNTPGASGLSFVQQKTADLKAGVSAAALMGDPAEKESTAAADFETLLSGVTQAKATNTLLRGAGVSALGLEDSEKTAESEEESADGQKVTDIKDYSEIELRSLLQDGSITTGQYLGELMRRETAKSEETAGETAQSAAPAPAGE